ncbi:MAG: hypothetical protein M5U19_20620 [Microthrixaceae bacterium]|nr:hypothetical protein [Microthrixaceae bacterium]
MLTAIALAGLPPVLQRAAAVGRDRVVVVTDAGAVEFHDAVDAVLDATGWNVLDSSATPSGHARLFLIGRS